MNEPILNPHEDDLDHKNKRLARFERDFKEIDLARYFQLKYDSNETIEIEKTIQKTCVLLTIRYTNTTHCPFFNIPTELNERISEYLIYKIEIHTKIEYSKNYPFSPPIWFIKEVIHNIKRDEYGPFYLLDYYIDKINHHNNIYNLQLLYDEHQWHPAISIEGDILIFLQRINHFDELIS
jgi:hypothetical protein